MINSTVTQNAFVVARNEKDLNKPVPKLLLPSIQTNLRAGKLGQMESNQVHYIKIPVNKI